MKILISFGTRPEALKLIPIIKELDRREFKHYKICITGQHRHLLNQVLDLFNITPHFNLNIMESDQPLDSIIINTMTAIKDVFDQFQPDLVVVQGDTTSAFAVALASYHRQIPVAHIEAGLRTFNIYSPFPEEANRQFISCIATYHFAPTKNAVKNLERCGITKNVFLTGNTSIDMVLLSSELPWQPTPFLKDWINSNKKYILITAHRRESFGRHFQEMCQAFRQIALSYPHINLIYPVHLNPNVQKPVHQILNGVPNLLLLPPVDYLTMVNLMRKAHLILTDSGGIQEEAPAFHIPVLVMRDVTERPEGIEAGIARLVGRLKESIINNVNEVLTNPSLYLSMCQGENPYGDGKAAQRIVEVLLAGKISSKPK